MCFFKKFKFEWLIIVFIHDFKTKGYESSIENFLKEFQHTGIDDNHAVLLIHDKLIDRETGTFKTFFMRLMKCHAEQHFCFVDIPVTEVNFKFHDGRSWARLLKWIGKNYKARKICISTLSDGAGFGILGDDGSVKPQFSDTVLIPVSYAMSHAISEDKALTSDKRFIMVKQQPDDEYCKSLRLLWISELSDAIRSAFRRRKVDILMLNNCYMQTFETGWILRDRINYLAAAETLFTARGFSMKGLLEHINKEKEITADDLIATIIPDFIDKWRRSFHFKRVAVMVNKLEYYSRMKVIFERVAKILVNASDEKVIKIIELRQREIENVTNDPKGAGEDRIEFIDLQFFLNKLPGIFPENKSLAQDVTEFGTLVKTARNDRIHIGDNYKEHDSSHTNQYGLQGISVFLPFGRKTSQEADVTNCAFFGSPRVKKTRNNNIPFFHFVNKSKWDEFVARYVVLSKDK